MIKLLRRLVLLALLALFAYLALLGAVTFHADRSQPPATIPRDAIIVVLSAGQERDGSPGSFTTERLKAGIELFQAANAEKLLLTGGKIVHDKIAVAQSMAGVALAAGIPTESLIVEPNAQSTLQNALFSAELVGERSAPVVLLTHRFHMPRAWASFYWAGLRNVTPYPVDTPVLHRQRFGFEMMFQESKKILLNASRVLRAEAARATGQSRETYLRLLD